MTHYRCTYRDQYEVVRIGPTRLASQVIVSWPTTSSHTSSTGCATSCPSPVCQHPNNSQLTPCMTERPVQSLVSIRVARMAALQMFYCRAGVWHRAIIVCRNWASHHRYEALRSINVPSILFSHRGCVAIDLSQIGQDSQRLGFGNVINPSKTFPTEDY